MQMVAASKMRKAQNVALAGRPYSKLMNRVLVSLQQRTDSKLHPLLQVREVKKELVVVSGRKAREFIARTRRDLLADFELKDAPSFAETKAIARFCIEKFLNGEV